MSAPGEYKEFKAAPPAFVHVLPEDLDPRAKPEGTLWTGATASLPEVGARVAVRVNQIGSARVSGYFTESGFVGLIVKPDDPPAWYVKQNGKDAVCHVFGAEID